jgi:hypothetical protein
MATFVWTSIFGFLAAELVITLMLVVPVPLKIRAWFARRARIVPPEKLSQFWEQMRKPLLFIGIGLGMALVESFFMHQHILDRIEEERHGVGSLSRPSSYFDYFYPGMHDKERKYKSERNMYLSGFALTLLFVIGRITTLLRESVELHEEAQRLEGALSPSRRQEWKRK